MHKINIMFLLQFVAQNVVCNFFVCQSVLVLFVFINRYLDHFSVFSAFRSSPWSGRPTMVLYKLPLTYQ